MLFDINKKCEKVNREKEYRFWLGVVEYEESIVLWEDIVKDKLMYTRRIQVVGWVQYE